MPADDADPDDAKLLSEVESANKALFDEWLETAIEYKVGWERELERRAKLGIKGPEPLPHPDDVIIDMWIGQVKVKGPMTKEEKVEWDQAHARVEECDREIAEMTASALLPSVGVARRAWWSFATSCRVTSATRFLPSAGNTT